jgi:hypothetical protein
VEKKSEIEFCRKRCDGLAKKQERSLEISLKNGKFIGIGKMPGRTEFMPLLKLGNIYCVIDENGALQLASDYNKIPYV